MNRRTWAHVAIASIVAGLLSVAGPSAASSQPRVIDGEDILITDAPWQVGLLLSGTTSPYTRQFCGGSIIGAEWILTAAHCVVPEGPLGTTEPKSLSILSGTAIVTQNPGVSTSESEVSAIIVHPDYNRPTLENDIALVRLKTPLSYSSSRQAIAVPSFSSWPMEGTTGFATGWGRTVGDDSTSRPTRLQGVTLEVLASPGEDECGEFWSTTFYPDVMLCAGIVNEPAATCNGDSGGPLAVDVSGVRYVAGVTSWGKVGCSDASVFARVTTFAPWITASQSATLGSIRLDIQPASQAICAYAYSPTLLQSGAIAGACSDAAGVITIPNLLPGDYKLSLATRGDTPIRTWWAQSGAEQHRANATVVTVTGGLTTSLSTLLGTIKGMVKDSSGLPRAGVTVTLEEISGIGGETSVETDATGAYKFIAPPGVYRTVLRPRPSDNYRPAGSSTLALGSLQTLTADFTLSPGAGLNGVVHTLAGTPISGAIVAVHTLVNPTFPDRSTFISETTTSLDGTFSFSNLPAQAVQVHVQGNPFAAVRYTQEWYHNAEERNQATSIPLTVGRSYILGPVVLEAVSGTTGTLTGRVSDRSDGLGVADAEVRLTTEDGTTTLRTTTTDAQGQYEIASIAPGTYGLDVVPTRSSPYLASIGDLVTIVGGDTTERNTTLERGGGVIGYAKTTNGDPIAGISVEARIFLYGQMLTIAATKSNRNGEYWFAALPTDREVTFYYTSAGLSANYQSQWYSGATFEGNADYITPVAGVVQALVDALMVPGPPPTGDLRGRVLDEGGNGLEKVSITAYSVTGTKLRSGTTDEEGSYTLTGLPAGDVYLHAVDDPEAMPGHMSEWYLDAADLPSATASTVVGSQTTTVAPMSLAEGVGFRGVIEDERTSKPVSGTVNIVDLRGVTHTLTATQGTFRIGGLPGGDYVAYVKPNEGYLAEWWEEVATATQATRIEAEEGSTRFVAFYVSKTPSDPVITEVRKISMSARTVGIYWEATVGAGRYQLQRQQGQKWVAVKTTPNLAYVDILPRTVSWGAKLCYRLRVTSAAGVSGPWTRDCSA